MQSEGTEIMESGNFSPTSVHLHVMETTPVYVHAKRIPNKTTQMWTNNVLVENRRRPKLQKPWVPPGRLPCRKDVGSHGGQRSRAHHQSGSRHQCDEEEIAVVSTNSALLREQESIKSDFWDQRGEKDTLLSALVDTEIDSLAVSNQLSALRETMESHSKNKQLANVHVASLKHQQKLLLQKIDMFDCNNRKLRDLLREWADYARESPRSSEERDALKKQVADSETENIQLLLKVTNMEKEMSKLFEHLEHEKHKAKTSEELSRILQSTHNHLESELNRKEAEKAHLNDELQRMQQRAEQAEESARQFERKLQEKETELAKALSTSNDWFHCHSKVAATNAQLEEEISALKLQLTEFYARLQSAKERSHKDNKGLMDQIHCLRTEKATTDMVNKRLKHLLTSTEDMLKDLQSDAHRMRSSIREHDGVLEEYKKKIRQIQMESNEYCLKLETTQKEMQEVKLRLEMEKDQVKQELEMKTNELRSTKQQLRDAQQEGEAYQRQIEEDRSVRTELQHRLEHQDTQVELIQNILLLQEENKVFKEELHMIERKMKVQDEEFSRALSSKEAIVQHIQKLLEEKTVEYNVLSRQLQKTVDDAQKHVFTEERTDLQLQLTTAKAEQAQIQQSKEKMEHHYQSELKKLKNELEQSHHENHILHNHVQHLNTSFGNVFNDSLPQE